MDLTCALNWARLQVQVCAGVLGAQIKESDVAGEQVPHRPAKKEEIKEGFILVSHPLEE